tara:strand:- start:6 stop:764 length:759 start_codon:yes stop_codon:yes gene_type:complete
MRRKRQLPESAYCPKCFYVLPSDPDGKAYLDKIAAQNPDVAAMDECQCERAAERALVKEQLRWDEANLPFRRRKKATLENFKPEKGTEATVKALGEFVIGKGVPILHLLGGTGCGKTHLLEAVGRKFLEKGLSVRYEYSPEVVERFRATFRGEKEDAEELMLWYQMKDLLVVDDLGAGRSTDFSIETLGTLVDQRIRSGKRMIVTSNIAKKEVMVEALGPRLASRLYQTNADLNEVKLVVNTAEDYRDRRAG